MNYIPPYSQIRGNLNISSSKGDMVASISFSKLEKIIRDLLMAIKVDEDWYRSTYPDIDEAIRSGVISTAREHFVQDGYFEGRLPFPMTVDEEWYLSTYEDIASAVKSGSFESASDHFANFGYEEGRLPCRIV